MNLTIKPEESPCSKCNAPFKAFPASIGLCKACMKDRKNAKQRTKKVENNAYLKKWRDERRELKFTADLSTAPRVKLSGYRSPLA